MIKLIQFLFSGCWHEYETIGTFTIVDDDRVPQGTFYHLKCKKCGDVIGKTLRPRPRIDWEW